MTVLAELRCKPSLIEPLAGGIAGSYCRKAGLGVLADALEESGADDAKSSPIFEGRGRTGEDAGPSTC